MADPTTPNMGLIVSQGGSTPGANNNVTSNTYPNENSLNMTTLDNHTHVSGQGLQIPTAALDINANLGFNGYNLTGVGGLSCTTLTVSSTLSAVNLTASGGNINTNTMTVLTNDTSIQLLPSLSSGTGLAALVVSNSNALTTGDYLLWMSSGGGTLAFAVDYIGNTILNNGGILSQGKTSTSLTLEGNAANSGVGIVLDNATAATTGKLTSFRTGGTEKAYIDHSGSFVTTSGSVTATNVTASGFIEVDDLSITATGHIITANASPTFYNINSDFGTLVSSGIVGGDTAMICTFEAGTEGGTISAGTALFVVELANAYSSTNVACFVNIIGGAPILTLAGSLYAICTNSGARISVYSTINVLPQTNATYTFSVMSIGAGATS